MCTVHAGANIQVFTRIRRHTPPHAVWLTMGASTVSKAQHETHIHTHTHIVLVSHSVQLLLLPSVTCKISSCLYLQFHTSFEYSIFFKCSDLLWWRRKPGLRCCVCFRFAKVFVWACFFTLANSVWSRPKKRKERKKTCKCTLMMLCVGWMLIG